MGTMRRPSWPFTALLLCLLAICLSPVFCAADDRKAEITETKVFPQDADLKVSFRVLNCFKPEMEQAILSGVTTTFRFLAMMEKPGLPLLRERLVDVSFEHTIKYDRLRNEFVVLAQEQLDTARTTRDFSEAKGWMSEVRELPLLPLWRLDKGTTYSVYLKAELSKLQLPPFVRYVFVFAALWDFSTYWQETSFTW